MLTLENDNKLLELRKELAKDEMTTKTVANEIKSVDTKRVTELIGNYHNNNNNNNGYNKLNSNTNTNENTIHNNFEKKDIMYKQNNNSNWKDKNPQRMEIWYYDFGKGNGGCTQAGIRPCLISSNILNNKYSTIRNVFPITSRMTKADIPVHVKISTDCGLKEESIILTEQITTIDIRHGLLDYVGEIDEVTMKLVDKARNIQLGDMVEKTPLEKLPKYLREKIEEKLDDIYTYEKAISKAKNQSLINHLLGEREAFLLSLQKFCKDNNLNYKDYYVMYKEQKEVKAI